MTLLKNDKGQQASVMISFRGRMPKQIVITGDKGFVVIDDFARAEKAVYQMNDGSVEVVDLGEGKDVFTYELDTLNQYIKEAPKTNDLRETTEHVILVMDEMRKRWENN